MTPLARLLRRRIATEGPLTVAQYMVEALGHPRHGYYATRDPLGEAGDFTTAPEISQIFGELLGAWCAHAWDALGRPSPVHLVELGPGRGTLMADAWRAMALMPGLTASARLWLVETSPTLRRAQAERLADARPQWVDRFADVPEGPILAVANEFFDALPIRQFQKTSQGWRERLIDWDEAEERFRFALSARPDPGEALIPAAVRDAPEGAVAEICPPAWSIAADLGRRITTHGGACVIIDYGSEESAAGDSFQAVRSHGRVDPLADPGEADLTAHVDFEQLKRAISEQGARVEGPHPQGAFLEALGVRQRAGALMARATSGQRAAIASAVHRLTSPTEMGSLFKVLTAHGRLPAATEQERR